MDVSEISLEYFRNHTGRKIKLSAKTIITGANGSGKTSVLEAARVVSVGKSFRTSRSEDLIAFNQPYLRVSLKGNGKVFEYFYGQQFAEDSAIDRRLSVGGKPVNYIDFLGTLPTVSFTPKDVDIITEQPSLRRAFVDGILWQASPEFRRNQLEYSRVLKERSQLLFLLKINRAALDELRPWNELMLGLSKKIRRARNDFVAFANQTIAALETAVPGRLSIRIEFDTPSEDLAELQPQEIKLSQNLFGPHRDELKILNNDRVARRFASRGQARSSIALLKAVEAMYLQKNLESAPVILLDDLISELDQENVGWLFEVYGDQFQLIATSITKAKPFSGWEEVKL